MIKESEILRYLTETEKNLSEFAKKSNDTLGRKKPISPDPSRLEFARDETRILHSAPFRRLKHKTQVFLSPDNDHICTRMEHVLHVSSIATVLGRCLRLNTDLIAAIAKGHDLGHPPFGHIGEKILDKKLKENGFKHGFKHEIHGLRVVDKLTNYGDGLNLTYEVRDGIINHCGEKFEQELKPDRSRDLTKLEDITERIFTPSTLEGCLVRMVDKIAYLGRDLEDGIKAGLVKKSDVPKNVVKYLGTDNGKIIGNFVNDIITNSIDNDRIKLGDTMYEAMLSLKNFNYERIYHNPDVEAKANKGIYIVNELFDRLVEIFIQSERGTNEYLKKNLAKEAPTLEVFFNFIKNTNYTQQTSPYRIVADYVAGMSDTFAQRSYIQLFLPSPII